MRYFKKSVPSTPVYLKNGQALTFETADGVVGYKMLQTEWIIQEVVEAIQQHRGGISEVSKAEYDEFVKKKQTSKPFKPTWREEMHAPPVQDTILPPSADASHVAVEPPKPEPVKIPVTSDTPTTFKPVVGRRKA